MLSATADTGGELAKGKVTVKCLVSAVRCPVDEAKSDTPHASRGTI
jgi:hypothetical protein